jgi:hypothetical protein
MIRIDAFTRLRDSTRNGGPVGQVAHIEISPADHEEPTWEVRGPGDQRRSRLDLRTRAILSGAAAIAILVNAGAAWVYWRITGSQTGHRGAEIVVEMALRARSDLNRSLLPGRSGNMTVTVTNDYDFPIRITSVTPGAGNVVADDEHRDRGCKEPGVTISPARFAVSWDVPRNTIGAFTIPDALLMRPDADPVCAGAVFTVPVQASGVSRNPS